MAADSPAERQIVIRAIAAGRPAIARQMPPELGSGARELAVVDRDRIRAAAGLVVRYADVPIGLADASCIVLPEAYRDRVIAILDRHPRSPSSIAILDRRHFGVLRFSDGSAPTIVPSSSSPPPSRLGVGRRVTRWVRSYACRMTGRDELSTSFGAQAGAYEAGRPDYPREAVAWMLAPVAGAGPPKVADVGAGTGKLTRVAVALGAALTAVDPDEAMLDALHAAVPGVPTHVGTAERLPLADESQDAVILGQAWHWVDPVAGTREIARVLRPGGVLGLIWNIRDESTPWVRRLTEIMRASRAESALAEGGPQVPQPFGPLERRTWSWNRPMTRSTFLDMVRSRSYVITAPPAEKARIEDGLSTLLDELGAIGDAVVELPYLTEAFRAVRP